MSYEEITCPYCDHSYDLCHDDGAFYNDGKSEVEECPECGKKYLVHSSMSWSFDAEKAECLNDGNHVWVKRYNQHMIANYPPLAKNEECERCGEQRTVTLHASPSGTPDPYSQNKE